MKDDPHQGLVLRSLVEVFYYSYLGDVGGVILHRLEPLEEGAKRLAILSLDGLGPMTVLACRRVIGSWQ